MFLRFHLPWHPCLILFFWLELRSSPLTQYVALTILEVAVVSRRMMNESRQQRAPVSNADRTKANEVDEECRCWAIARGFSDVGEVPWTTITRLQRRAFKLLYTLTLN